MLEQGVAEQVQSLLKNVVMVGTGTRAQVGDMPISGKTGTTEGYGDAWFVGWTPDYTIAVWVGYPNEFKSMETEFNGEPVAGGTFPAGIFKTFVESALRIYPPEEDEEETETRRRRPPRRAERHRGAHGGAGHPRPSPPRRRPSGGSSRPGARADRRAAPRRGGAAARGGGGDQAARRRAPARPPYPPRWPGPGHVPVPRHAEPPRQLDRLGDPDPLPGDDVDGLPPRRRRLDDHRPGRQVRPVVLERDARAPGSASPVPSRGRRRPRRASMCSSPSSGSSARISTAAPTPSGSQTALSSAWMPYER